MNVHLIRTKLNEKALAESIATSLKQDLVMEA